MVSLKIQNINKNLYQLKDIDERVYELTLKFLDIDVAINIDDVIYMDEHLLSKNYEGYSTFYTFGSLESVYGKANISLDDIDVIELCSGGRTFYLKRLYG